MRLPMVRRIIQWVPIEGTRWRNEVTSGQENHGVDSHYGVAPGDMVVVSAHQRLPTHPCVSKSLLMVSDTDLSAHSPKC